MVLQAQDTILVTMKTILIDVTKKCNNHSFNYAVCVIRCLLSVFTLGSKASLYEQAAVTSGITSVPYDPSFNFL